MKIIITNSNKLCITNNSIENFMTSTIILVLMNYNTHDKLIINNGNIMRKKLIHTIMDILIYYKITQNDTRFKVCITTAIKYFSSTHSSRECT